MSRPRLIVVSGPAGAGKTTLAHRLATEIGCPAVSRDEIKEGMALAVPDFLPAPDDPLTRRTYALFFDVIGLLLRGGVSHVAEAAFQDPLWRRGLEPLQDLAELRIVRCRVTADVATARAGNRLGSVRSRRVHADAAHLAAAAPFVPLALPAPTLDVDSTDGYRPSLAQIAAFAQS